MECIDTFIVDEVVCLAEIPNFGVAGLWLHWGKPT